MSCLSAFCRGECLGQRQLFFLCLPLLSRSWQARMLLAGCMMVCRLQRCFPVATSIIWAACVTGCNRAAQTTSPVLFAEPPCLSRKQLNQASACLMLLPRSVGCVQLYVGEAIGCFEECTKHHECAQYLFCCKSASFCLHAGLLLRLCALLLCVAWTQCAVPNCIKTALSNA